jgi:hypothetical protein
MDYTTFWNTHSPSTVVSGETVSVPVLVGVSVDVALGSRVSVAVGSAVSVGEGDGVWLGVGVNVGGIAYVIVAVKVGVTVDV